MRHAFIAVAAIAGSALCSPALALQPLPPGAHGPGHGNPSIAEPPDPCIAVRGAAHARCVQRHQHLRRQTRRTTSHGQY